MQSATETPPIGPAATARRTSRSVKIPILMPKPDLTALTGGFTHVCGLTAAGKAYEGLCW